MTGALVCWRACGDDARRAGGSYVFLTEAYGRPVGFLYGWSQFLIVQSGTIAAVAVAFANFTGILMPQISGTNYIIEPIVFGSYAISLSSQQLVAIASIALLTLLNTRGLRLGRWIQNTFTVTKTAALLGLIIIGLVFGWNHGGALFSADLWNTRQTAGRSKRHSPPRPHWACSHLRSFSAKQWPARSSRNRRGTT